MRSASWRVGVGAPSSMKSCCALRLALRELNGTYPKERWTCSGCGQSYRWQGWKWEPVSTVDEIHDMMQDERT